MTIDNWLVVDGDQVVNVIVVDSNDQSAVVALRKQHQMVMPSTPQPAGHPGIGWKRGAGNRFDPPPPPPDPQAPAP